MPLRSRTATAGALCLALIASAATASCQSNGARADGGFDTSVDAPAYAGAGPVIHFDEAHNNLHRSGGTYRPFAELMTNDGYVVRASRDPFTTASLRGADVVVIANALGRNERNDDPAMSDAEADALVAWVRGGGSLLLVTDHYPMGHAVSNLASRFRVDMSGGLTEDTVRYDRRFGASEIVFEALPGHPITRGVDRVLTFGGQSLGVPEGAVALLPLGPSAIDRAATPRVERDGSTVRVHVEYGEPVSAEGRAQAIALTLGRGRVVVLGEAAMASAQVSQYDGSPFGMNVSGYDNRTFMLNAMHWLSRLE